MAYKTEYMQHPVTKSRRDVPVGFSWTTLFFGFFPALIRGDFKWAIIMFIIACITGGLSWFVFPFFYNHLYREDLVKEGYIPLDSTMNTMYSI